MHILAIFHLKFGVWCICGVFIIKGFTLKNEGANIYIYIYYVGDSHYSFLEIFVCNKNKLSSLRRFSQIWLETKYEVQIFNHLLLFLTTNSKSNIRMVIFIKFFLHSWSFKTSNIYLWKEVVYLICLSQWNLPSDGASCHALGVVGNFSMNKGVLSWFHNVSTYSEKVIENNFFIENSFK
jgi:hypothetical protein